MMYPGKTIIQYSMDILAVVMPSGPCNDCVLLQQSAHAVRVAADALRDYNYAGNSPIVFIAIMTALSSNCASFRAGSSSLGQRTLYFPS